jgi:DDE family transposase
VLKDLDGGVWKTRIAEPQRTAFLRWHGDTEARDAVYANRNRLRSEIGKAGMRRRAEIVERSFAHNLERGGLRRTWLRGRENVHKRYLIHVAGHNLGILMRLLMGAGTPKEAAARGRAFLFVNYCDDTLAMVIFALAQAGLRILVVIVATEPT